LSRINSEIEIEAVTVDVNHRNIGELVAGVDVIVDGTDNFDTRFLLNDASLHYDIPWIYGGCIGSEGQTLVILPGETPCLRCLMSDTPPPGTTPTCDSAGILGPVINVIASLQAAEAIKILAGRREAVGRKLTVIDVWDSTLRQVSVDSLRESGDCEACVKRDFSWLRGERGSHAAVLCGRNAVQISFPERAAISFEELAARWSGLGEVRRNPFLIRLQTAKYLLTLFADGRAIIGGTEEISEAKSVYAKYVGN
jgi:adenylyltransferase/sulfurtransferase